MDDSDLIKLLNECASGNASNGYFVDDNGDASDPFLLALRQGSNPPLVSETSYREPTIVSNDFLKDDDENMSSSDDTIEVTGKLDVKQAKRRQIKSSRPRAKKENILKPRSSPSVPNYVKPTEAALSKGVTNRSESARSENIAASALEDAKSLERFIIANQVSSVQKRSKEVVNQQSVDHNYHIHPDLSHLAGSTDIDTITAVHYPLPQPPVPAHFPPPAGTLHASTKDPVSTSPDPIDLYHNNAVAADTKLKSYQLRITGHLQTIRELEVKLGQQSEELTTKDTLLTKAESKVARLETKLKSFGAPAVGGGKSPSSKNGPRSGAGSTTNSTHVPITHVNAYQKLKDENKQLMMKYQEEYGTRRRAEERNKTYKEFIDKSKQKQDELEMSSNVLKATVQELQSKLLKLKERSKGWCSEQRSHDDEMSRLKDNLLQQKASRDLADQELRQARCEVTRLCEDVRLLKSEDKASQECITHLQRELQLNKEIEATRKLESRLYSMSAGHQGAESVSDNDRPSSTRYSSSLTGSNYSKYTSKPPLIPFGHYRTRGSSREAREIEKDGSNRVRKEDQKYNKRNGLPYRKDSDLERRESAEGKRNVSNLPTAHHHTYTDPSTAASSDESLTSRSRHYDSDSGEYDANEQYDKTIHVTVKRAIPPLHPRTSTLLSKEEASVDTREHLSSSIDPHEYSPHHKQDDCMDTCLEDDRTLDSTASVASSLQHSTSSSHGRNSLRDTFLAAVNKQRPSSSSGGVSSSSKESRSSNSNRSQSESPARYPIGRGYPSSNSNASSVSVASSLSAPSTPTRKISNSLIQQCSSPPDGHRSGSGSSVRSSDGSSDRSASSVRDKYDRLQQMYQRVSGVSSSSANTVRST